MCAVGQKPPWKSIETFFLFSTEIIFGGWKRKKKKKGAFKQITATTFNERSQFCCQFLGLIKWAIFVAVADFSERRRQKSGAFFEFSPLKIIFQSRGEKSWWWWWWWRWSSLFLTRSSSLRCRRRKSKCLCSALHCWPSSSSSLFCTPTLLGRTAAYILWTRTFVDCGQKVPNCLFLPFLFTPSLNSLHE